MDHGHKKTHPDFDSFLWLFTYLRHIGKWSSTAGGAEAGLNHGNLEVREPEKDIVDRRLRASCSYPHLSPPSPVFGQVQARFRCVHCHTHWGSAVCSFFECIGVVCFDGEGDPVRVPS